MYAHLYIPYNKFNVCFRGTISPFATIVISAFLDRMDITNLCNQSSLRYCNDNNDGDNNYDNVVYFKRDDILNDYCLYIKKI